MSIPTSIDMRDLTHWRVVREPGQVRFLGHRHTQGVTPGYSVALVFTEEQALMIGQAPFSEFGEVLP